MISIIFQMVPFIERAQRKLRGPFENFWTHVITPNQNFVEVRWRSLFRSTSLEAMHFLQRSTSFSKTCCRPLITSKFLPFHGWKSTEITWDKIWIELCVQLWKSGSAEPHQNNCHTVHISPHAISELFQPRRGISEARNFEVINGLWHVFEKWVERFKKRIACHTKYFEKETVTAPPQSSNSE
jgi:hypothetical protein